MTGDHLPVAQNNHSQAKGWSISNDCSCFDNFLDLFNLPFPSSPIDSTTHRHIHILSVCVAPWRPSFLLAMEATGKAARPREVEEEEEEEYENEQAGELSSSHHSHHNPDTKWVRWARWPWPTRRSWQGSCDSIPYRVCFWTLSAWVFMPPSTSTTMLYMISPKLSCII